MGFWRKVTGWRSGWVVLAAVLCVLQAVPGGFGPGPSGRPAAASDEETRRATSRTTYSCPSPPSGYQYSRRSGRTCYYTKTQTTSGAATSRTTYSCSPAHRGYRYSHLSGSTCHYTRTATTTAVATSETTYSCASTHRGYRLSRRVGRTCFYSRTDTATAVARSSTTYSCASTYRGYRLSHRRGRVCYYSRTYTTTRSASFDRVLRRFTCPSTYRGYRYSRLSERTCYYTRNATATAVATSRTAYSCSSTHRGYRLSRRTGRVCYYSRTSTATAVATSRTTYSCSSTYRGYQLSRRSGSTCHYSRTLSTTAVATSETTYSCPSVHRTHVSYLYSHRNGSLCYYSRTINQTRPAIVRTTYSCPSAPANHRFSRRRGSTCYYTPITTTTTTTSTTTTTTTTTTTSTTTTTTMSTPTNTTTQATATTAPATTTTTSQGVAVTQPSGGGGQANPTVSSSLPAPRALEANGHSNSSGNNQGKISISWTTIGSTAPPYSIHRNYEIQYQTVSYNKYDHRSTSTYQAVEGGWNSLLTGRLNLASNRFSKEIENLGMKKYYEVQIRTIGSNNLVSDWSESVYVYTTHEPVPQHKLSITDISLQIQAIGLVRAAGFRAAHNGNSIHAGNDMGVYSYVICAETLPSLDPTRSQESVDIRRKTVIEIERSIGLWGENTSGMVQAIHYKNNSNLRNCNGSDSDQLRNRIRLLGTQDLRRVCRATSYQGAINGACVKHDPNPVQSTDGRIDTTDIYIYKFASLEKQGKQCSRLLRISMHEAGHAFGLADDALIPGESVMNMPADNLCAPTSHDVATIKAIYQSRSSTQSGSSVSSTTTSTTTTTTMQPTTTTTLTTTTSATTTTTATSSTTASTTATSARPVTVWQIETLPSSHQARHTITTFVFSSGNAFTYAGRTYTIQEIKVYNRGARIKATPDLEDYELPGGTLLRFWPTDDPSNIQTLRLSDATEQVERHQWDIIWQRNQFPVNVHRNTTWHIDLTIPVA